MFKGRRLGCLFDLSEEEIKYCLVSRLEGELADLRKRSLAGESCSPGYLSKKCWQSSTLRLNFDFPDLVMGEIALKDSANDDVRIVVICDGKRMETVSSHMRGVFV